MGTRVGIPTDADPGPAPAVPEGRRSSRSSRSRCASSNARSGVDLSGFADDELMNIQQYNLFPNMTLLVYADLVQVLRARPGATPNDAILDGFFFERHAAGDATPAGEADGRAARARGCRLRPRAEPGLRTARSARSAGCTNPG